MDANTVCMDTNDTPEFYLSVCQAARLLGISPESVRRRISRGQLPAVRDRVSRRFRIPHAAIMALLEPVTPAPVLRPVALRPMSPQTRAVLEKYGAL